MDFNIKIDGLDFTNEKISKKLKQKLKQSIFKTVFLLEKDAKLVTPVRTGLLRNSYEEEFKDLKGVLYNTREYGPYVEARKHFIQNTIENDIYKIEDIFKKGVQEFINNI